MAIQMKHKTGRAFTLGNSIALFGLLGLTFAFSSVNIGCGSSPPPKAQTAGNANEETGTMGGEATEHDTVNKAGAAQLIPKEKKRADQRRPARRLREGDAAVRLGQEVRRPLGQRVQQRLRAFKSVADENPGLLEARFNQGAVLQECGREDDADQDLARA